MSDWKAKAPAQRAQILGELQAAGGEGVASARLYFDLRITNVSARISELREAGHVVEYSDADKKYRWKAFRPPPKSGQASLFSPRELSTDATATGRR